jgi:hypothetical protein
MCRKRVAEKRVHFAQKWPFPFSLRSSPASNSLAAKRRNGLIW